MTLEIILRKGNQGVVVYKNEKDQGKIACLVGEHSQDDLLEAKEGSPLATLLTECLETDVGNLLLRSLPQYTLSVSVRHLNRPDLCIS